MGAGQHRVFLNAFLLAAIGYGCLYGGIQWRRSRLGPWQVSFTQGEGGYPVVQINQHRLGITNQELAFLTQSGPVNPGTLSFVDPKPLPFEVPFGQCVFMDTTFLPGSVTLRLFGHTVELLPRTLIIDNREHPWKTARRIELK